MSTNPIPPAGENPLTSITEQMELLKFLREESASNRQSLNDQAEADRSLLKHILWVVSVPLSIALAAATWFGISSITSLKQSIQDQAKVEGERAIAKTTAELQNKVDERFQTDTIRGVIHAAAVVATRDEANPLIRDAVKSQVGTAVAAQGGQIEAIAIKAVREKVATAVAPLAAQASETIEELRVQKLIARANSDDARALDQLLPLADHNTMVIAVIEERRRSVQNQESHGLPGVCIDPKSVDFISKLGSPNRQDVIANCATWIGVDYLDQRLAANQKMSPIQIEEEVIPLFVDVSFNDSSLIVRARAIWCINRFFEGSPGFPEKGLDLVDLREIKKWWQENKADYVALMWISRMRFRPELITNIDSTYLFDHIVNIRASSPRDQEALENTIRQLRSFAEQPQRSSESSLKIKLGRDNCESVKTDLAIRIKQWESKKDNPPYAQILDTYGTNEIAFTKSCPSDLAYLSLLSNYGSKSVSVSKRYGVISTVNAWIGTHLDPFDGGSFGAWWAAHAQEYPK